MPKLTLPIVLSSLLLPVTAWGHALLVDPPPRDTNTNVKTPPCQPTIPGTSQRTTLVAGSTFNVQFMETIDHPGYYELHFSLDGETDLTPTPPNVLDKVADQGTNMMYTRPITVPSTPCENCTLRLVQCMLAGDPTLADCAAQNQVYYYCADIRIVAADGDAGPIPDGGAGGPDGGVGTPDGGAAVDDGIGDAPGLGLCSAVGPGARTGAWSALWLALAAAAGLLARRRLAAARRR